MTYWQFLLVFLGIPIVVLSITLRQRWLTRHTRACLLVCLLAFVYTSPWDNHASRIGLWSFDPHFAPPSHFIFALPWEEYAFYFLQGIVTCLLAAALSRFLKPADKSSDKSGEL